MAQECSRGLCRTGHSGVNGFGIAVVYKVCFINSLFLVIIRLASCKIVPILQPKIWLTRTVTFLPFFSSKKVCWILNKIKCWLSGKKLPLTYCWFQFSCSCTQPDFTDQLCRSHKMHYCFGFCRLEVAVTVYLWFSAPTALCGSSCWSSYSVPSQILPTCSSHSGTVIWDYPVRGIWLCTQMM